MANLTRYNNEKVCLRNPLLLRIILLVVWSKEVNILFLLLFLLLNITFVSHYANTFYGSGSNQFDLKNYNCFADPDLIQTLQLTTGTNYFALKIAYLICGSRSDSRHFAGYKFIFPDCSRSFITNEQCFRSGSVAFWIRIRFRNTDPGTDYNQTKVLFVSIHHLINWAVFNKKKKFIISSSVVDPNTLNLDPDPGFWPNLDPEL